MLYIAIHSLSQSQGFVTCCLGSSLAALAVLPTQEVEIRNGTKHIDVFRESSEKEEVRSSDEAHGQSRPTGGAGASIKNEALYETEDRHRYVHP